MALWLQGAVDERGCQGEGCPTCPYQIFMERETWACTAEKYWRNYSIASELWRLLGQPKKTELWWLLGKPQRSERLQDIFEEMKRDEDDVLLTSLS